jgi:hypothetical protein
LPCAVALLGVLLLCAAPGRAKPDADACRLRFLHAAPGRAALSVFLDGRAWVDHPAFGAFSPWREVDAGTHNVKVAEAGQEGVADDADGRFEAGIDYTLAYVPSREGASLLRLVERVGRHDQASVRFVHLAAAGPATALLDGQTVASALSAGQATEPVPVAPGEHAAAFGVGADQSVAAARTVMVAGGVYSFYLLSGEKAKSALTVVTDAAPDGRGR